MATIRQRKAAQIFKETLESKNNLEKGEILEISGYSAAIQKNPQYVFESEGFKEALEELGFSLKAADMTVAKILRTGKEENQLRASEQIYKRLGGYAAEKHDIRTLSVEISKEIAEKNGIVSQEKMQ